MNLKEFLISIGRLPDNEDLEVIITKGSKSAIAQKGISNKCISTIGYN
jgi:hypothetical protein